MLVFYIAGLAVALVAAAQGLAHRTLPMILMTALLGLGLFSYYMGRSAEPNLVAVAYPGALLAGILCAEAARLVRAEKLPPLAGLFLLPARVALIWWAFLFIAALPDTLTTSRHVLHQWRNPVPTPLEADAAFAAQRVRRASPVSTSSPTTAAFTITYPARYERCRFPAPSNSFARTTSTSCSTPCAGGRSPRSSLTRIFEPLNMYRPDVYQVLRDAIAQNYRLAETSPDGRLALYLRAANATKRNRSRAA